MDRIPPNADDRERIPPNAADTDRIPQNAVNTNRIPPNAVDTDKIAQNAVATDRTEALWRSSPGSNIPSFIVKVGSTAQLTHAPAICC